MAKQRSVFTCQKCGSQFPRWEGRCGECGEWNSLVEEIITSGKGRGWSLSSEATDSPKSSSIKLSETVKESTQARTSTGFSELDRVLGGGLVSGSYILLGGDPGIGKSTLLMQMSGGLANSQQSVLYVSGEESVQQTALRAQRLGIKNENIEVAAESQLEKILDLAKNKKPQALVVDSIQTVYLTELSAAPGSVSQVRECAARLMALAKGFNITIFLIGHVTKEGHIAGPKVLEHMVDTVLSFEGDSNHQYRLLRSLKNRFGATNELGVFQMNSLGLEEVLNPSELFLEERGSELIGSAIFSAMEGTRPLLCEVQALTNFSPMAMPRRTSIGFETNRVHLLSAVLDKQLDLDLFKNDIYINVVGGLKLSEPSADLAIAAAVISSTTDQEIPSGCCFFGEIGLTGEIRAASFSEDRVREATKLGFSSFVIPESNKKHLKNWEPKTKAKVFWLKHIGQLPNAIKDL